MSLPPEKIGDAGQRFMIQATGWPYVGVETTIGYSGDVAGAEALARALLDFPSCTRTHIVDRQTNKRVTFKHDTGKNT